MKGPIEATIAVTYRCNSRCAMCNIWKIESHDELPFHEYSKLPRSLRTINITGGEPFLREDIVDVVREIHGVVPRARIVISSNGYLTKVIGRMMTEMMSFHPRIGIGISIDGLGETHDRIRGVNGGFERATETLETLRSIGVKDVRLGMTLMKDNAAQVLDVFKLACDFGVEFTTAIAHNSEIFFRKEDNEPLSPSADACECLDRVIGEHLRSYRLKNWFRAYHLSGILNPSVRSVVSKNCPAGIRFFFMDPSGDVYPCLVMNRKMGNIRDVSSFEGIMQSAETAEARACVQSCKSDCWMICNTRSMIANHPGKAIAWVAKNKLQAHFSRKTYARLS